MKGKLKETQMKVVWIELLRTSRTHGALNKWALGRVWFALWVKYISSPSFSARRAASEKGPSNINSNSLWQLHQPNKTSVVSTVCLAGITKQRAIWYGYDMMRYNTMHTLVWRWKKSENIKSNKYLPRGSRHFVIIMDSGDWQMLFFRHRQIIFVTCTIL
jgi:hypothetical protein